MNNYTYVDSYNIFNITQKSSVQFNISVFVESLILNDKIVTNVNNPEDTLSKLVELCGQDILIELIKEGIITFAYDFMPFRLMELKEAKNKICRFELEDYNTSIEQLLERSIKQIQITEKNKKKLNKVVLDNLKVTGFEKVDRNELNNFIIKNINQNEIIYQILKANKPYHLFLDHWRKLEYEIEMVQNSLYLVLKKSGGDDVKYIGSIFGGAFLLPIVRAFISIISAEENNCTSLWGNNSTEAIFEANYDMLSKKESEHFQTLIKIENMPNIAEMIKNEQISINRVIKIRDKSQKLRKLIYDFRNEDDIKMITEYFKEFNKEEKFLDNTAMKTIRFIVGCIHPGIAAADTFILPIIKNKLIKTVRIRDILK